MNKRRRVYVYLSQPTNYPLPRDRIAGTYDLTGSYSTFSHISPCKTRGGVGAGGASHLTSCALVVR